MLTDCCCRVWISLLMEDRSLWKPLSMPSIRCKGQKHSNISSTCSLDVLPGRPAWTPSLVSLFSGLWEWDGDVLPGEEAAPELPPQHSYDVAVSLVIQKVSMTAARACSHLWDMP